MGVTITSDVVRQRQPISARPTSQARYFHATSTAPLRRPRAHPAANEDAERMLGILSALRQGQVWLLGEDRLNRLRGLAELVEFLD